MIKTLSQFRPFILLFACACFSASAIYLIEKSRSKTTLPPNQEEEIFNSFQHNRENELQVTGRQISFTEELELINQPTTQVNIPPTSKYILLYINDNSCNVCADEESKFAQKLATKFGVDKVIAVLHTATRRAAINYCRLNNITFPVLYDKDNIFAQENNIPASPIMMLVTDGTIVVHIPIVGHLELCEPYHRYFDEHI